VTIEFFNKTKIFDIFLTIFFDFDNFWGAKKLEHVWFKKRLSECHHFWICPRIEGAKYDRASISNKLYQFIAKLVRRAPRRNKFIGLAPAGCMLLQHTRYTIDWSILFLSEIGMLAVTRFDGWLCSQLLRVISESNYSSIIFAIFSCPTYKKYLFFGRKIAVL
jgi:hypothetical protein